MTATILCYHKVGPEAQEGRKLNIEPRRLDSHVRYFVRRRHPILLARDLADSWPEGAVCFTFDDAYQSTMTHAPQVFVRYGVRASFYAVGGKVGATSDWDGVLARPLAGWDLLIGASAQGHEIGNHTFSHVRLAGLAPEAQAREVREADRVLREQGLNPSSFCYPYGSLDDDAVSAVCAAGYSVGLALGKRHARTTEDRLALGRIVVAFSDSLPLLLYRLYLRPRLRFS